MESLETVFRSNRYHHLHKPVADYFECSCIRISYLCHVPHHNVRKKCGSTNLIFWILYVSLKKLYILLHGAAIHQKRMVVIVLCIDHAITGAGVLGS